MGNLPLAAGLMAYAFKWLLKFLKPIAIVGLAIYLQISFRGYGHRWGWSGSNSSGKESPGERALRFSCGARVVCDSRFGCASSGRAVAALPR
jgi:hypothetical protein